ncbi:MAG: type II secretory pathway protein [Deltaproteobacteria bacterium]|nr:MAG: type II secretory pathway protein [Deltaproteobacteria bacterium]
MYFSYYNLNTNPFKISTDPKFLWLGEEHKEALAVLKYGVLDNKGFLLLTGDVGTGKTTLINSLIKSLDKDVIVGVVLDPDLEKLEFFNFISNAFGMNKEFVNKSSFLIHFNQFLHKSYEANKKVLLIIDEAQRLNSQLLEEIRLLSNLEKEETKLLNIFFIGQNEFNDILLKPENRALKQRITISYNIDSLTENETDKYIRHRLKIAGGEQTIFDSAAICEIFFFSKGYPRLINIICDLALLSGFVQETKIIGQDIIKECAKELEIKPFSMQLDQKEVEKEINETKQSISVDNDDEVKTIIYKQPRGAKKKSIWKIGIYLAVFFTIILVISGIFYFQSKYFGRYFKPIIKTDKLSGQGEKETINVNGSKKKDIFFFPSASGVQETQIKEDPAENNYFVKETGPEDVRASDGINAAPKLDTESQKENRAEADGQSMKYIVKDLPPLPDKTIYIYFSYNSNELSEKALKKLDQLAAFMIQNYGIKIFVKGYTDSSGNYNYNLWLSDIRANIVKTYLISKGIRPYKIETRGMGPENPIASNDTAEGRNANRRIEIEIIKD